MNERLNALARQFDREVQARARRSLLVALGAGLVAAFALGAAFIPVEVSGNLLLTYAVFLAPFAIVLAVMLLGQFSGPFGDALAVATWGRLHAEDRWKRLGAGRLPRNRQEAQAWLAAHPDEDAFQAQHLSARLGVGDLAAARATLPHYPTETPAQRYELASDAWFVAFLAGEALPLEAVTEAAAAVDDEPEWAAVGLATTLAHAAVASGGDWMRPLAEVRPLLGPRADGLVGTRFILATWTVYMGAAAVMVGIALFIGRSTGIWG